MNRVGAVLVETYRIERLIGEGGMGSVYEASHLRLPKRFAIKFLNVSLVGNLEALLRFRREAEVVAGLDHPSIVNLLDYNLTDDGVPYIVLEYLDGEHLGVRLGRGKLGVGETMRILVPVAQALEFAHKRDIVHRDLKPENILILKNEQAKVVDFGIAKIRGGLHLTAHNTILGTVPYMAPEQLTGGAVDARSDQFALAAIVYEMLSGTMAFPGEDIMTSAAKVAHFHPPPIEGVGDAINRALERALAKLQKDRFPSVEAFAHEMVEAASAPSRAELLGQSGSAPRPGAPAAATPKREAPPAPSPPVRPPPQKAPAPAPSTAMGAGKPVAVGPPPPAKTPSVPPPKPAAPAPAAAGKPSPITAPRMARPGVKPIASPPAVEVPSSEETPLPRPAPPLVLAEPAPPEGITDPELGNTLPPLAGDATTITMRPEGAAPVEEDPDDQVAEPPPAVGEARGAKRVSTDPDVAPPPPKPREPPRFDITSPLIPSGGSGGTQEMPPAPPKGSTPPPWEDSDVATVQMAAAPPRAAPGDVTDRTRAAPVNGPVNGPGTKAIDAMSETAPAMASMPAPEAVPARVEPHEPTARVPERLPEPPRAEPPPSRAEPSRADPPRGEPGPSRPPEVQRAELHQSPRPEPQRGEVYPSRPEAPHPSPRPELIHPSRPEALRADLHPPPRPPEPAPSSAATGPRPPAVIALAEEPTGQVMSPRDPRESTAVVRMPDPAPAAARIHERPPTSRPSQRVFQRDDSGTAPVEPPRVRAARPGSLASALPWLLVVVLSAAGAAVGVWFFILRN